MIKLVSPLGRRDGYSHEEFVERRVGEHSELTAEMPGLKKYATDVPTGPERSEYDGIVERSGEAAFADVEAGPTTSVEETVQFDDT